MSTEPDRAIEPTEIEITPEMIEAVDEKIFVSPLDLSSVRAEAYGEIFRLMTRATQRGLKR